MEKITAVQVRKINILSLFMPMETLTQAIKEVSNARTDDVSSLTRLEGFHLLKFLSSGSKK